MVSSSRVDSFGVDKAPITLDLLEKSLQRDAIFDIALLTELI